MREKPITKEGLHQLVTHVYWKYHDTNLSPWEFAEFLLVTLSKEGVLRDQYMAETSPQGGLVYPKIED